MKLLAINGSPQKDGQNGTLLALAIRELEGMGAEVEYIDFKDYALPFYDPAIQAEGFPDVVETLRAKLDAADGFVISQPEYNYSIPAAVKNFIDWMSRYRPHPFTGKHAFLMSASPSMVGGNRGLWALNIPLTMLGVHVYPNFFSLAQSKSAFNEDGGLANDMLAGRLTEGLQSYVDFVRGTR